MLQNPTTALDLPLKIIAWEDEEKKVWLAWNDAIQLEERYSLPHSLIVPMNLEPLINKVFGILPANKTE